MDMDVMDMDVDEIENLVRNRLVHNLLQVLRTSNVPQFTLDRCLQLAVRLGHVDCTRILIAAGGDVNKQTVNGEPILLNVIRTGSSELLECLISEGYNVNHNIDHEKETHFPTPLHLAISTENIDLVEILLKAGLRTEYRDALWDTALITACNHGDVDTCDVLLKYKCDINARGFKKKTALHRAIEREDFKLIELLLKEATIDVNIADNKGDSPLFTACKKGMVDVVTRLLNPTFGYDIYLENNYEQNALNIAAAHGKDELIELLIEHKVDIHSQNIEGHTPIMAALYMGHIETALKLLNIFSTSGSLSSLNRTCKKRKSVLHYAAERNVILFMEKYFNVVKENNLDSVVNGKDMHKDTPLVVAAKGSYVNIMDILLKHGADVNCKGKDGRTALHWSVLMRHLDSLNLLLNVSGIDPDITDKPGDNALILAAREDFVQGMQLLLNRTTTDINTHGSRGDTALHWACRNGSPEAMILLLMEQTKSGRTISPDSTNSNHDTPALLAAKYGNVDMMFNMIKNGADVNFKGHHEKTLLHYVCEHEHPDVVQQLCDLGVQNDEVDDEGNTPLIIAAIGGNIQTLRCLLNARYNVNIVNNQHKSALYYTCQNGDVDMSDLLLKMGAHPDYENPSSTCLIQAVKKQNSELVHLLLNYRANINCRDQHGRTALLWAAQMGDPQLINCLLHNGADPRWVDSSGDTALTLTAFHSRDDIVDILIPLSDIDHQEKEEGMSALYLAISKDDKVIARKLIDTGADINLIDQNGNNAMLNAVIYTTGLEIVEQILKSGKPMNINQRGTNGRTTIHWAVGEPETLQLLLDCGPDLDVIDDNGASPLLLAIAHGEAESAKMLIQHGCNINMKLTDGRSPLHHSALYGDDQTLRLLLQKDVAVEQEDDDGKTALLLACIKGNTECVKLLLQHGSTVNNVYFNAITPLSVAADNMNYDIVELLLENGANPNMIGPRKHCPLINAILKNDLQGVVLLLQGGANLNEGMEISKHPIQIAAVRNHLEILYLLAFVECDINCVKQLLKDGALYDFIDNDHAVQTLKEIATTPPKLQMLCRDKIRSLISYPILPKIAVLNVPDGIIQYLKMEELTKFYLMDALYNFRKKDLSFSD